MILMNASLVVFSNFLKTSVKQMVIYHSELVVLQIFRGIVTTCPFIPKTCDHLLGSAFCSNPKKILFVLTYLERALQPIAVYVWVHTHTSKILYLCRCCTRLLKHHDVLFEHFFTPIYTSVFLSYCRIRRNLVHTNHFYY